MKAVIILALLIANCNGSLIDKNDHIVKQIVGGIQSSRCEFPHMAYLLMEMPGGRQISCGGALLDSVHILTAAHCVKYARRITAYLGNANYELASQVIKANRWATHDDYVEGHRAYDDIGMIRLEKPVKFSKCVQTISLPGKGQVFTGTCTAAGWGAVSSTESGSAHMRRTQINIIPTRKCQKLYYEISPNQHICVGDRTHMGGNICSGDSGSPLMCMSESGYVVAGVASNNFSCDDGFGVYVNVAGLLEWVEVALKTL